MSIFAAMLFSWAGDLAAQSPEWSAVLMAPAYPSPFVSEWERNPQNLSLTIVHTGQGSAQYQVEALVREARRGEVARAESPLLEAEGLSTTVLNASELSSWRARLAQSPDIQAAIRSGVIPEGEYEICVRVLTPQRIQLAQDCVRFSVILPDAPQLVFPGAADAVLTGEPTFQWTPVLLPPVVGTTYRLRIVERHPSQTPQTALRANRLHHEAEVSGTPFFRYPLDALPLEPGKEYVWQVEALDGMGEPLLPGGLSSEVWTFRADRLASPGAIPGLSPLPDTLELVPGTAWLIGLRSLEGKQVGGRRGVVEDAFGYRLNGKVHLEVHAPFQARVAVELDDLVVDKMGSPLRITGGSLHGRLALNQVPEELRGNLAHLDRIEYSPTTGLVVQGRLKLPGGDLALNGEAQVTAAGLYGVLEADLPRGRALTVLGSDPVELRVNSARLTLPGGQVDVGGSLALFGTDIACEEVSGRIMGDGSLTLDAGCIPQRSLPLIGGGDRAQLALHTINGQLTASLTESTFDYELAVRAGIYLDTTEGEGCSAQIGFGLTPGGLELNDATPRCDRNLSTATLDWLALGLSNLRVDRFGYQTGRGFDFALRVDIEPSVSTTSGFVLPTLSDIEVSRDGLRFPGFDEEPVGGPVDLAGYRLRISRLAHSPFTLSWADWNGGKANAFDFELTLTLSMPEFPEPAPSCLAANSFRAEGRLSEGKLRARIIGDEGLPLVSRAGVGTELGATFEAGSCRLAIAEGLTLEVERLGGEVEVELFPAVELLAGAELAGGLELTAGTLCRADQGERIRVGGGLRLDAYGGLTGQVSDIDLPCALDLGAVALRIEGGELEIDGGPNNRVALLHGGARGIFSGLRHLASGDGADPAEVVGDGSIALDLISGEIVDGSLSFSGPIRLDLPREAPLLSFTLNSARLDRHGLHLDGRNSLELPGGESIGTTFNNVAFSLDALRLSAGEIRFDSPFAIEAGLGADGVLAWRAVGGSAPLGIESGARIELPSAVVLDTSGLRVEGAGGAQVLYEGRDLADLAAEFSDAFALGFDPLGVNTGLIEFRHDGILLAYIDETGFHPNFAQLALGLIPDRLGLPNTEIAYLELRDSEGNLDVTVSGGEDGDRILSRPGGVPLVVPALAAEGADAPRVMAEFELVLDALTNEVIGGSLTAQVPTGAGSPFDLTRLGVPFIASELAYRPNDEGQYEFGLTGQLHLLGENVGEAGSLALRITESGTLAGEFEVTTSHGYALVPGSDRIRYTVSGLEGSFDFGLLGGVQRWSVQHDGQLEVALGEGTAFPVSARLLADQRGLSFSNVESGTPGLFHYFDLDAVRLGLGNLRIPRIEYTEEDGWDFDIDFDLALSFPELGGLEIPGGTGLREIRLGTSGFTIPKLMVGELRGTAFEWGGFSLRPLAFRMDPVHIDLFGTGGPPADWGFSFDFELALGDLPQGAPLGLEGIRLSALDLGYRGGRLTGTIEPFEFPNPISLPLGLEGMAFELLALGGRLNDLPGLPRVQLDADLAWTLPSFMRCDGDRDATLALVAAGEAGIDGGAGTFQLAGDGSVSGRARGLVPSCPLELGPFALQITSSELDFAYSPSAVGSAELQFDGRAELPGLAVGDTIRANGSLRLDLLTLEVLDGSIDLPGPFRWDLPREDPFLQFVVERGRLDSRGFTLAGTGDLRVGDDEARATVGARFNDLTLGLPDFAIRRGNATFENDFAIAVTMAGGGLNWSALPASAPRPEGDAFRFTVPGGAVLSANGLALSGESTAELAFADSVFSTLTVAFEDGFQVGVEPVGVNDGRAGFSYNGTEIAFVDRTGFHPGDIFGVLPVPDTLALPTTSIAFLELRDPSSGQLRVETSTTADGLQLSGRNLPLVIPALGSGDGTGTGPGFTLGEVQLVLDPQTFRVIGGSIEVTGEGGTPLIDLTDEYGLPITVNRLRFADDDGTGHRVRVGLGVKLPDALRDLMVALEDIVLSENGLAGEVLLGSYHPDYELTDAPLAATELLADEIDAKLKGLRIHFGQNEIDLAGEFGLALFADSAGNRSSIPFTAEARGGSAPSFVFTAQADSVPGGLLSMGFATFEPKQVGEHPGLALRIADDEVAVRLGGEFRVPSLGEDFAVTVSGIEVGTKSGVVVPEVELTTEQEFTLFGAAFRLKRFENAPNDPGLAVRYDGSSRVLSLELSGEIEFPFTEQVPRFRGLRAASDGTFSLAHASLLSERIAIIDDVLTLDDLSIESDSLRIAFGVELPEPLSAGGKQSVRLAIAPDGSIAVGGGVVFYQDDTDENGAELGIATVHLRYLDLDLRNNDGSPQAAVRAVADFDLMENPDSRISLGWTEGGTVRPGLTIDFTEGISWGNTRVRDSIFLPFEMIRFGVHEVAVEAGSQARDLVLGLNGFLAFDVEGISGGLEYEDLRLTGGLDLDRTDLRVMGGHFNIANVVSLEVSNFAYSAGATTIVVAEIGMPTESSPDISSGTREVQVSSFVQLGGRIGIGPGCDGSADDCLFSGGADLIQFYQTPEGQTSFVVREASLVVDGVLDMEADLLYRTGGRGGFEILLGAQATLLNEYEAAVVGLFDNTESSLRAGLFVRVDAQVPLVPPLMLEGLGGGFFYNPRSEHIALVKKYANMPAERSGNLFEPEPGAFTGLLYASASLGGKSVAQGRVLLTVSDSYAQLQGELALLEGGGFGSGPLARGYADLTVGFKQKFADGNFILDVDLDPIASGGGELGFYVYGADAWGIYGGADLEFVRMVKGEADFFVGSPGFLVSGSVHAGFDFWIVAISSWMDASIWYQRNPMDLGAYMEVGARASLLGGLVSGSGVIRGAMLAGGGQSPLIYGGARAQGCVKWVGCANANIWAKFRNGSVSGGFGKDPALDEILARASAVRDGMQSSREEMEKNIAESRPPLETIVLSREELAEIYRQAAGDFDAYAALVNLAGGAEMNQCRAQRSVRYDGWDVANDVYLAGCPESWVQQEQDYYEFYTRLLYRIGFPKMSESEKESYPARVAAKLTAISGLQEAMGDKLDAIALNLSDLQELADEPWPESPLNQFSVSQPTTVSSIDEAGNEVKTITSGPGFDVDAATSSQIKSELAERQARTDALLQRLRSQIEALEAGSAAIQALLRERGEGSIAAFLELHTEAITAAEEEYTRHADLLFRQKDWYEARGLELRQRRQTIEWYMQRKSAELSGQFDAYGRSSLYRLTEARFSALDQISKTNFTRDFQMTFGRVDLQRDHQASLQLIEQSTSIGTDIWYNLARTGMESASAETDTTRMWLLSDVAQRLRGLREQHRDLTDEVHRLSVRHADLVGIIYDLYDRYDNWLAGAEAIVPETTLTMEPAGTVGIAGIRGIVGPGLTPAGPGAGVLAGLASGSGQGGSGGGSSGGQLSTASQIRAERSRVETRMRDLEKSLQVPSVGLPVVMSKNLGHMAEETFTIIAPFGADHYEYLFEYPSYNNYYNERTDFSGWVDQHESPGLRSAGRQQVITRHVSPIFYQWQSGQSINNTFLSGVRGGAGYLGVGRTEYTTHFGNSGGGPGKTTTAVRTEDTTPPRMPFVEFKVGGEWTTGKGGVWIAEPERLEVRWRNAYDAESGIAEYEYSIGLRNQPGSVLPWTSAGGRTSVAINNANLREDAGYFIYARARNGSGLWSEVAQAGPFQVDSVAPAFPAGAELIVTIESASSAKGQGQGAGMVGSGPGGMAGPGGMGGGRPGVGNIPGLPVPDRTPEETAALFPTAACVVPSPTFMHQAMTSYRPVQAQASAGRADPVPTVRVERPTATDQQSGIAGYYMRVDRGAPATSFSTEEGWTPLNFNQPIFTLDQSALDYSGEHFVSVVAVDYAGHVSEPLVASFMPEDRTPPFGTAFCAGQHSVPGTLFLAISSAAVDPESKIRGYQYRVRAEDGTIVRDWPGDLEVTDFRELKAGTKVTTGALPLVDGDRYFVDLRAINNHGLREVVSSGPFMVDFSPPPTPAAEVLRVKGYDPPGASGSPAPGQSVMDGRLGSQLVRLQPVELLVRIVAPDDPHSGLLVQQWEVVPYRKEFEKFTIGTVTRTVTPQGGAGHVQGARGTGIDQVRGGTSAGPAAPPHGRVTGAQTGFYRVTLTSNEMRELNKAEPGSEFELRIRTINALGVPSMVHKARFTLPDAPERERSNPKERK